MRVIKWIHFFLITYSYLCSVDLNLNNSTVDALYCRFIFNICVFNYVEYFKDISFNIGKNTALGIIEMILIKQPFYILYKQQ